MDQIFYAGNMVVGSSQQYVLARRSSDGSLWRYNLTSKGLSNGTQVGLTAPQSSGLPTFRKLNVRLVARP